MTAQLFLTYLGFVVVAVIGISAAADEGPWRGMAKPIPHQASFIPATSSQTA
jgi:hypothetical protein